VRRMALTTITRHKPATPLTGGVVSKKWMEFCLYPFYHATPPARHRTGHAPMAIRQDITDVLRKARAATLLTRVRARGTLSVDAVLLTAWAASGWTLDQIITAAHDLAGQGTVSLTTTQDEVHIIAMIGGAE